MSNHFYKYTCGNCGGKFAILKKYSLCSKCYYNALAKKSRENGHVVKHKSKICACIGCKELIKSNKHKFCTEHSSQAKDSIRKTNMNRIKIP